MSSRFRDVLLVIVAIVALISTGALVVTLVHHEPTATATRNPSPLVTSDVTAGADPLSARATKGSLIVKVPRGLLPSEDYWVYVDGEIVAAPPYAPFVSQDLLHVPFPEVGEEYWDADGLAAKSAGGRFTYLRPGLRERIFKSQRPVQLPPGKYVVELLTRRVTNESFPFAIARIDVEVSAGKTEDVEFGVPTGTDESPLIRPTRPAPFGVNPDGKLKYLRDEFIRTRHEYDELWIVVVLDEVMAGRALVAEIPKSLGGGRRELDVRQLSLMVDVCERYKIEPLADLGLLRTESMPLLLALGDSIRSHNESIESYRRMVTALRGAAKR